MKLVVLIILVIISTYNVNANCGCSGPEASLSHNNIGYNNAVIEVQPGDSILLFAKSSSQGPCELEHVLLKINDETIFDEFCNPDEAFRQTILAVPGNYVFVASGTGMDKRTVTVIYAGSSGVTELGSIGFQIFPIPVLDMLTIRSISNSIRYLEIRKIDGSIVLQSKLMTNETLVDFGHFANGLYIIKIKDENNQESTYQIIR